MVSTGSYEHEIKLPAPTKVIGVEDRNELVAYGPADPPTPLGVSSHPRNGVGLLVALTGGVT